MNLQKVKTTLEKVNRYYAYLESNQELTSRVDFDAFLAAIRNLYDVCFDDILESTDVKPNIKPENESPDTETKVGV